MQYLFTAIFQQFIYKFIAISFRYIPAYCPCNKNHLSFLLCLRSPFVSIRIIFQERKIVPCLLSINDIEGYQKKKKCNKKHIECHKIQMDEEKKESTNSDAHRVHSTSSFKFSTSQQQSHNQALIHNLWGQFWSLWIFN